MCISNYYLCHKKKGTERKLESKSRYHDKPFRLVPYHYVQFVLILWYADKMIPTL